MTFSPTISKKTLLRFRNPDGKEYPEWREVTVKEIFDLTRGVVIPQSALTEKPTAENIYPVYSSQTKNNGILGWDKNFDFNGRYLTWTTDGANAGKVFARNGKFRCTNVCGVLVEKQSTIGYANIALAEILNKETPKHVSYVGNPKLMNNVMGSIKIVIPSLEEQLKISSFLTLIERKIQKQQEKIEQLELFKKGMMQKIFSQEIRFKDDNGKEFPDWDYVLFEQVATNKSRKVNPQNIENVPCIELENIIGDKGQINGYFLSHEQQSTKNQFKKGSILFGKLRPYLKKYWFATFDGVCSSEIWVITSIDSKICNEYLYFVIQSDDFQKAANISSGSKMPRTEWDSVKNLEIPLPSLSEQKKIASFFFTLEEKISKELSKKETLIKLKSGLMQQMFV